MATNTQFSIAVHLLAGLGYNPERDVTSGNLALSVNTCPSFVRRVMAKLSKANLVVTTTGKAGFCTLARKPEDISLLDIYQAVGAPSAFAVHEYPEQQQCLVSKNIKSALNKALDQVQHSMNDSLSRITLADIIAEVRQP